MKILLMAQCVFPTILSLSSGEPDHDKKSLEEALKGLTGWKERWRKRGGQTYTFDKMILSIIFVN